MIYDFSKIICRIYPISIYIKMQDYTMTIDKILTRDDGSNWFVVDIGYEGKNAKLHSAYFSDMQSPTFIDDIKKLEDEQEI